MEFGKFFDLFFTPNPCPDIDKSTFFCYVVMYCQPFSSFFMNFGIHTHNPADIQRVNTLIFFMLLITYTHAHSMPVCLVIGNFLNNRTSKFFHLKTSCLMKFFHSHFPIFHLVFFEFTFFRNFPRM